MIGEIVGKWRVYVGYAVLSGLYLLLRFKVFHNPAEAGTGSPAGQGLSGACQIVVEYLRLMLAPLNLAPDHVLKPTLGGAAAMGLVLAIVVLALAWRRSWLACFGMAWLLIALAPVSGLVPVRNPLAERHAYVAAAGLCLIFGAVAQRRRSVLALAAMFAALTLSRSPAWQNSFTLWRQTAATTPDSFRTWVNLAGEYRQQGHLRRAVAASRRAVALAPGLAEGHVNLGLICLRAGDLDTAAAELQRALELDPKRVKALKGLADVNARAGKLDEAIRLLGDALRLEPGDGHALTRLGCFRLQTGQKAQARECFEAAVRVAPGLAEAHNDLGSFLWQEGDLDAALVELRRALELDPDMLEASYNLACVSLQRGRLAEAARHFQRVLERRDGDPARRAKAAEALQALRQARNRD